MPRSADKLAFALSSAARVSRQQYKRVFDHLLVTDGATAGVTLEDGVENLRRETACNLEALGICDFLPDDGPIASCPPALAVLPPSGLPAAFLTGARTPDLLARVRAAARRLRASVLVAADLQPAFPLLPRRYWVVAASADALKAFADDAGIPVIETPLVATLLGYSASVAAYVGQLRWQAHIEPDWQREDFDTERVRFTARHVNGRRLSRYTHPTQSHWREFRLVDGDRSAEVDRIWARFVTLAWAGVKPWHYDEGSAELLLPVTLPLPRLYSRALVACSGFAPVVRTHGSGGRFRVYMDVPPGIVAILDEKLASGPTTPISEAS